MSGESAEWKKMTDITVDVMCHALSKYNVYAEREEKLIEKKEWAKLRKHKLGEPGYNCPITSKGREQAKKLHGNYDLILSSPLRRCRQTIRASGIKSTEIVYSRLLRESIEARSDLLKGEVLFDAFEDGDACEARARLALQEIARVAASGKRVLVVSHSHILHSIMGAVAPELARYLPNAQIVSLRIPWGSVVYEAGHGRD